MGTNFILWNFFIYYWKNFVRSVISLSKAMFRDFSLRGYENGFFLDWWVKLHRISFQTPYSVSVGNFFEVRFHLIVLWILPRPTTSSICIPIPIYLFCKKQRNDIMIRKMYRKVIAQLSFLHRDWKSDVKKRLFHVFF